MARTPGSYVLLTILGEPCEISAGALGARRYPGGYYLYCGSALNGLTGRLARHARKTKHAHWHVDHFLAHATLLGAWVMPATMRLECLARAALSELGGVPFRGFGSSDCRCPGHLLFFAEMPAVGEFDRALHRLCPLAPPAQLWLPSHRLANS